VVIDGVEDLLPALRGSLQVKWPNDVMACGRKLGGVLCEATSNTQQSRVVVGIGLNLKVDFTNSGIENAISLQEVSGEIPEELVLLERLRYHLIQILEVIRSGQELTFFPRLRERDLLLHRSLTILSAGESFSGQGAGIDSGGRLLIRLEKGEIRAFVSGQVSYFLKP
jgi:BirA family biotin operon repressor/biotin-[acetyl-CoA-carboxylase] ligase